jgi:hypothetical protein
LPDGGWRGSRRNGCGQSRGVERAEGNDAGTEGEDRVILFFPIFVSIVLPEESDLLVVQGQEPVVTNSDAMSVPGQISEHGVRSAERSFSIDHPVLLKKWAQEEVKSLFIFEGLESSGEVSGPCSNRRFKLLRLK